MLKKRDSTIVERLTGAFRPQVGEPAGLPADIGGRFYRELHTAGVTKRSACGMLVTAAGFALSLGLVSRSFTTALAALAVGLLLVLATLRGRAKQRRAQLERDLPALLTSIASSVRAGIDPITALMNAHAFFAPSSLLAHELYSFRQGIRAGEDEGKLIEGFMGCLSSPDLELFKRCIILSRRHGASLAEPLHRVVKVIRQRQSFRRKTRGALAMHRLSAIGIAACALFIGGLQVVMNLSGIALTWQHPVGSKFLMAGVALIVGGIGWMMSLGREEAL